MIKAYKNESKNESTNKYEKLIKKAPVAVLVTIIIQAISVILWAAKLDQKVETQQKWITEQRKEFNDLFRIEERVKALNEEVNQLEEKVYDR